MNTTLPRMKLQFIHHRLLLILLFVGLLIRILFIGNTGFVADIAFWKSWSLSAIDHGIVKTTEVTNINYPPGFIYVLWFMGKLYSLFADPHDFQDFWRENNFVFLFASKSVAIAADIAIAVLIYWFAWKKNQESRIKNQKAHRHIPLLLAAAFYFNPIVILDSALWGQVESFGILFTVVAMLLVFRKHPVAGSFLFSVGTLMKLQNIIFIPLFFLFIFRYYDTRTVIKSIAAATAGFFLTVFPFVLAGKMDKILFLLTVNSDYFPWLSLNAHNLWWIVADAHGMQVIDKITMIGIANAKTVGLLLFSSLYLLSCLLVYFKPTPRNILLAQAMAIFSFFLFTTQSHERYSYPVLVLLLFLYPFLREENGNSGLNSKSEARSTKQIPQTKNSNLEFVSNFGFRASNLSRVYFWLLATAFTLTAFFNMYWGLVANYPQNGFAFLTPLMTPPATIVNSYLTIFLFLLFVPYFFTQISYLSFGLCTLLFLFGLFAVNIPYIRGTVSLTAFKPVIISQGYGTLQINKSVNSSEGWKKWSRLSNNYFYYRRGFGTHAKSNLVFDINGKFSRFETDAGIDTEAGTPATVTFQVYGDGRLLYESPKMGRFDFPVHVAVPVTGIKHLGLVVTDAGDGISHDHADWFNPTLYK